MTSQLVTQSLPGSDQVAVTSAAAADRGLFMHELVIEATTKGEGLFCWPPPDANV